MLENIQSYWILVEIGYKRGTFPNRYASVANRPRKVDLRLRRRRIKATPLCPDSRCTATDVRGSGVNVRPRKDDLPRITQGCVQTFKVRLYLNHLK